MISYDYDGHDIWGWMGALSFPNICLIIKENLWKKTSNKKIDQQGLKLDLLGERRRYP